jgi:cytidine deaminase
MSEDVSAILRERALLAALKAYAPYSAFRVGAAVQTAGGAIYAGCNVENASFPVGGCAERHAIAAAVAAEGPGMRLAAIAVAALDPLGDEAVCAPCGACRQAILEFGGDAQVIFRAGNADDEASLGAGIASVTAASLLPGAFSFRLPAPSS